MSRSRTSLRSEREHLARIFGAIIVAVAPTSAVLVACDSVSDSNPTDASTSSTTVDAADAADGYVDAGPACFITATYFDSGRYFGADADAEAGTVDVGCIYNLPCGLPPSLFALGCGVYFSDDVDSSLPDAHAYAGCDIAEGSGCTSGNLTPGVNGGVGILCADCLGGGGRRPRGLRSLRRVEASTPVGAYFAKMAHEEAASVRAFRCMKQELLRFGAPAHLVTAASRAEREETLHTKIMQQHARVFGGTSPAVSMKKTKRRSLEAMAIENAVEGCVNETFGALLMMWQAQHAASADLRDTFTKIAHDEIGHAALSRELATWAEAQLDAKANARVTRARARAIDTLSRSSNGLENKGFEQMVGWPTTAERNALVQKMVTSLALG